MIRVVVSADTGGIYDHVPLATSGERSKSWCCGTTTVLSSQRD